MGNCLICMSTVITDVYSGVKLVSCMELLSASSKLKQYQLTRQGREAHLNLRVEFAASFFFS